MKIAVNRKSSVSRPSITSLVYVSTARPGLDQNDFQDIMTVAERNNQRLGITGLVMFNGFNFMQCIEGERAVAKDRLHRIGMDDRHTGLTILSHHEIANRQFAQWYMAGQYFPVKCGLPQSALSEILSDNSVSENTRNLFQSFRSLGARQAARQVI